MSVSMCLFYGCAQRNLGTEYWTSWPTGEARGGRLGHAKFLQVSVLFSSVISLTEPLGKLPPSYHKEKVTAFLLLVRSRK